MIERIKQHRLNTTGEYMAFLTAFFLLVNIVLGSLLVRQSSAAMSALMRGRMLDISNTAAAMLDGDALETVTPADEGSPAYGEIMRVLTCFQDNIQLEYIYCIRDAGGGQFVFGLDPTVEDPGEFGSPVVPTDALRAASRGTPSVDAVSYQDAWGTFYSAYSPVFNSAGRVAGIVAVDFSAKWYDAQLSTLIATTAVLSLVSLVAGAAIILSLTSRIRRRIRTVHVQLNELADNLTALMAEIESHEASRTALFPDPNAPSVPSPDREQPEVWPEDIDALGDRILAMQEELHAKIAEVHEKAYIDALTGARNKESYFESVRQLDGRIQTGAASFSVCVFDLNGLKPINDHLGHAYGDLALMDAANTLIAVFGKDNIYRIGGDEFIAILNTSADIQLYFAKLDETLSLLNRTERPYAAPLSLSKGCAVYTPGEDRSFIDVFRRADKAMYADKTAYYMKHGTGAGSGRKNRADGRIK